MVPPDVVLDYRLMGRREIRVSLHRVMVHCGLMPLIWTIKRVQSGTGDNVTAVMRKVAASVSWG